VKRLLLVALSFVSTALSAAEPGAPYELRGDWQQGSVLIGTTTPGAHVKFNGRMLKVSAEGLFVFGLDRDEKADAELAIALPGGKEVVEHHPVAPRDWDVQPIDGLPPKLVNPPPAAAARIKAEGAKIAAAKQHDTDRSDFNTPFIWPAHGRISGVFGSQRILNGEPKTPHYGVDVAVPIGTPVLAPAGGVVSLAERDLYFTGGTVIIDHGHGLQSILVHLSKVLVKPGDVVKQGQLVAESGMTGRATGPHLHWGLYWFNEHVDAQKFTGPMTAP
jgi:murein DD-endopeptidase MepM/ murein hydrolase activator NlpD